MTYCLLTAYPVGCTFLDWSLQWLWGHSSMYNVQQQQRVAIPADPLQGNNAHAHAKNHPCGAKETANMIQHVRDRGEEFLGLYPRTHDSDWYAARLGLDLTALDQQHWQQIHQHQAAELQDIGVVCQQSNATVIYINVSPRWHLYFLQPRQISPWLSHHSNWTGALGERNQISQDLPIWDWREQLALKIKPFDRPYAGVYINRRRPHVWLEAEDLWLDGAQRIPELAEQLGRPMDQSRLDHWLAVYQRWQRTQMQHLRLIWNLPGILDSILQGHDRCLPELDIIEEAVIQHCLIYAHNLNIRTWQLSRFPTHARDLHQLLEPNQHPIADATYRDLLRRSIDSLRSSIY